MNKTVKYIQTEQLVAEELEGSDEVIYMRPDDGSCFSLNGTAAAILEMCASEQSLDDMVDTLHDIYGEDRARIADDVEKIIAEFLAYGLINENSPDGHPTVSKAQTEQAMALWNWLYVAHEDKSNGVHNPDYAKALLEEGLARLSASAPKAELIH